MTLDTNEVSYQDLLQRTTVSVPIAGRVLGVGVSKSYQLAREGVLPTIKLGRKLVVPVPALLKLLGVEAA